MINKKNDKNTYIDKNREFKPLPFWRELLLSDSELCEYYLKKRKYEYQSGTICKGLKWRDKLHPALLLLIRLNRRIIEKQNLTIINDKRIKTDRPVIYAVTHIGVYEVHPQRLVFACLKMAG